MQADDPVALPRSLVGRVNDAVWDGKPPGTLLFASFVVGMPGHRIAAHVIHDPKGWDNLPAPDGGRYPAADALGVPPYPPAGFPPKDNGWEWTMASRNRGGWHFEVVGPIADEPLSVEAR